VVIEKQERVDIKIVQTFIVLETALKKINFTNLCIILNKCTEDDEIEDVITFYEEARNQASSSILPCFESDPEKAKK
jgi:hypothetical protein